MTYCEIIYVTLFTTIDLTLLHHRCCQIKNINYNSSLSVVFVREQFILELVTSREWILGIVLKLLILIIKGLIWFKYYTEGNSYCQNSN